MIHLRSNIRCQMSMIQSIDLVLNTFWRPLELLAIVDQGICCRSNSCLCLKRNVLFRWCIPLDRLTMLLQEQINLIFDGIFIAMLLFTIAVLLWNLWDILGRFSEKLMSLNWITLLHSVKFLIDRYLFWSGNIYLTGLFYLLPSQWLTSLKGSFLLYQRAESNLT